MVELKIDKEKLLKACEKCPQVRQFAENMWPGIFEKAKFKIGDIVEVTKERLGDINIRGKIGVVVIALTSEGNVAVEFQEDISGHDCAEMAKRGHGWSVLSRNLKLLYRKP